MSEEINLLKPSSRDAYPLYYKAKMHFESHLVKIESGQFLLNLIYSDVSGPYWPSCSGAKYYVTFLNNYDKTFKVILLLSKNRVLSAFELFWKCNQLGEACI